MLNGLNPINSADPSSILSSGSSNSLTSSLTGATSFDSIFTQAENQAKTPAQKLQAALLQVKYDNMNALFDAVSGNTSPDPLLGSSAALGLDLGSVTSQLTQLEQQLGINPTSASSAQATSNANAALGLQGQMLLNNDLASFGTDTGSGINTLA